MRANSELEKSALLVDVAAVPDGVDNDCVLGPEDFDNDAV